jgi:hypothetical protein
MPVQEIRIVSRYCGPPQSGNGGYSSGLVAGLVGSSVEVTLRRPPPLEVALLAEVTAGRAELKADGELVAEARAAELSLELPRAPSFAEALEATRRYVGHRRHHFPGCFVCGPERAEGDGLRIFPGEIAPGVVAAPWVPDASVGDSGVVRPEVLWAALDCVGYFAVAAPDYPVALLGRMTAEISGSVAVGESCVVLGFSIERSGRKLHAGTAVLGADGTVRGRARQIWITLNA